MTNEHIRKDGMKKVDILLEKYSYESDFTHLLLGVMKKEIVWQMILKVWNSELMIDDDLERIKKM